ncbi:MAG TPA: PrgI family protein [Streptosporangiaceae bacterium]|jgi:hypothetical protein
MTPAEPGPEPVRIPADIDQPDKILAGLTARQAAIAATAAVITWAGWVATRHVLPAPAFAVLAAPVAVAATALVTGERDGLSLDRLLAAAWRHARSPRRLVTAPEGIPAPPAWVTPPGPPPPALLAPLWRHITSDGVIGLGSGGAAAVAAVSTVNFALRTPAEQDALTRAYGRWLNSLTGPVQVLIRAGRADLAGAVTALRDAAPALPHPALEAAALEHAEFLASLAADQDVLTRQVLLVTREPAHATGRPGSGGTAAARAAQRAGEAARLLAGAGLQVRVLDGGQVTALLAACADPAAPLPPGRLAVPGQPVTGPGRPA